MNSWAKVQKNLYIMNFFRKFAPLFIHALTRKGEK